MGNTDPDQLELLITLTSDIVAAHVGHNKVTVDDVPSLITNVYGALAGASDNAPAEEPRGEPAVSIKASVKKGHIVCLECGKKMKMLKRHLRTEHGLAVDEYRKRWDLPADYPVVAPEYAETRRTLAKKIGLGRKPSQKRGRKKKTG